MKKAFLGRILGGIVAVATITSLSPLGVSAAGKTNNINNCFTSNCVTTNGCSQTKGSNQTNGCQINGNWFCLDSNGQLQLGTQGANNNQGCNVQCGFGNCQTNSANLGNCPNNTSNVDVQTPNTTENNNGVTTDVKVPETTENNNGATTDVKVPETTENNNGTTTDIKVPETTENNNVNGGTVKPENTDANKPSTTGESVNVNGLSKLPEKYAISIQNSAENKILELMNEKRTQAGLKPLTMDNSLVQVARYKSNHMIQYNYFDHVTPDGTKWTNWLQSIGYKYNTTGENIAYNTYDPVKLFEQWWNSQGHRENMMNPSYNKVGIGVIFDKDNNKYMGTQTFSN